MIPLVSILVEVYSMDGNRDWLPKFETVINIIIKSVLYSIFWQDSITNIKIDSYQIFWRLCNPFYWEYTKDLLGVYFGYTGGIFGLYLSYSGLYWSYTGDIWYLGYRNWFKKYKFLYFFVFLNSISILNLLTNASFRIGVPSILFSYKIGKNRKQKF